MTWGQLGIHAKPCGLLDVDRYFESFLAFLDHGAAEGFLRAEHRDALVVDIDVERLLDRLEAASPIPAKWAARRGPEAVIGRDRRQWPVSRPRSISSIR